MTNGEVFTSRGIDGMLNRAPMRYLSPRTTMTLHFEKAALNPAENVPVEELLGMGWNTPPDQSPTDWPLLDRTQWKQWRAWCGCDPQIDAALEETVRAIQAHPVLYRLARRCHFLVFEAKEESRYREWTTLLPIIEHLHPGIGNAFFLLLAIDAAPRLIARNDARQIPPEITRATLGNLALMVARYARYNQGNIGIEPRALAWYRLIASGQLHRIGRFEFIVQPFFGQLRVYRHQTTGRALALSEPGVGYTTEGYIPLSNQATDWYATLQENEQTVCGAMISPHGFARQEYVTLNKTQWELVLKPNDDVLVVHIPEGEPLTASSCLNSFREAAAFFTQHLQYKSLKAFTTNSWMFNTQLESMLPPTANLLAWQRELYLFPMPSTGRDGLYFLFNRDEIDLATSPRDTRLRRAIIDHLASGQQLRSGGMFFLFDDLPRYGTQVYRNSFGVR